MASPFLQAPGTSGQKPIQPKPLPLAGKFGSNSLAQGSGSKGLLTSAPAAPKINSGQGSPSMTQMQVGMMNTPLNDSSPIGQRAASATDGLKSPTSTLPAQFKTKVSQGSGQSSTQGGTNASLASNINPQTGQQLGTQQDLIAQNQANMAKNQGSQSGQNTQTGTAQDTTYGGLISQLANRGQSDSPEVKAARDALTASQLSESQTLGFNAKPLNGMGADSNRVLGTDALQRALYGNEQNALSSQLSSAVSTQGQQIGALNDAATGVKPQLGSIGSQQFYDPAHPGQSGTGTAMSSLPSSAQTAIQSYAQQVKNGSMTRADAESRLSAYGITGTNALNEALGPNFNTNASNASAGTTQQGQQLQTSANATNQALDTLQTLYNNLPGAQTGGIPFTNSIANWIGGQLGQTQLTQFNQTLHDARAQLQGVLTSSGAATPSGAESMALTYLPDNMTPTQFKDAIANVRTLVQQKVNSFTTSGQQNGTTNSTTKSGGLYDF